MVHVCKYTPEENKRIEGRQSLLRFVTRMMVWLGAALSVVVFFSIGPRLEVLLSPVVPVFDITDIEHREDGTAVIGGFLMKAAGRSHCAPVFVTAYTTDYVNPDKVIQMDFEPPPSGDGHIWSNRPSGAQEFGPWLLAPPSPPIGPVIILTVTHDCHALWNTTQVLYTGKSDEFFPANRP